MARWCRACGALGLALAVLAARPGEAGAQEPGMADSEAAIAEEEQPPEAMRLDRDRGYARETALAEQALSLRERALGPEDPDVARLLNNLAELYREQGAYGKAEPLYQRSLRINEKLQEHRNVATVLSNLALLYKAQGAHDKAEPLFLRALRIVEKAWGSEHLKVAPPLNNLADLYRERRAYDKAEPLYLRALRITEKARRELGQGWAAKSLNNLALLYKAQGAHDKAEPLLLRALQIEERVFGKEDPAVAASLNNLGELYRARAAYREAEPLYLRALQINERAFGREHPSVAIILNNLTLLYLAQGEPRRALPYAARAAAARERHLGAQLGVLPEARKRQLLQTLRGQSEGIASLHVQDAPDDAEALHLALTLALQRKGRVLGELASARALLRRNLTPALQAEFDDLTAKQAELAALREASQPGKVAARRALEEEVERREAELARKSVAFRIQAAPVTVEQVQSALPENATLVEFVRYHRFDARQAGDPWKEARYVAYVVRRRGPPRWAQLGEAEPIEAAVRTAHAALARPAADAGAPLRDLDARLLAPVRRALGGDLPTHLLLAPDGALHLVPFGALVDEAGKHLLEGSLVTLLGSGRDLLRMGERASPRSGPLVVAEPDFGPPGPDRFLKPLPATAQEAEAARVAFPGIVPQTGKHASKELLLGAHSPRFLLVATHGLFGTPTPARPSSKARIPTPRATNGADLPSALPSPNRPDPEEALDRTALALAGANAHPGALLTARQLAGLDLYGTKLVVLSACETGLGQVVTGEGVYGLRRALTIAGAESQVTSLWRVDDASTAALMGSYFRALRDGVGRSEALRQAQLSLLKQERYRHPYYWAAFVPSGDWRPLDGRDPPPAVSRGGCTCALVEARPHAWTPWPLGLLLLVRLRRRRSGAAGG